MGRALRAHLSIIAVCAAGCGSTVALDPETEGGVAGAGTGASASGGAGGQTVVGGAGGESTSSAASGGGGAGGDGVCQVGVDHGCTLWAKRFGDASDQHAGHLNGIAVGPLGDIHFTGYLGTGADFGGGVITGDGAADLFLAKLDASGSHVMSRSILVDAQSEIAVASATDGGSVVAGDFSGNIDLGGGPMTATYSNVFVGKYEPDGAHAWSLLYDGADVDSAWTVEADDAGNVYAGVSAVVFASTDNEYLLKYDPAGQLLWKKKACEPEECWVEPWGMSVGVDRIVVVGGYDGFPDFGAGAHYEPHGDHSTFVAAFTLDGDALWSRALTFPGSFRGFSIEMDAAANVYVAGILEGTVDFGAGPLTSAGQTDVVLLKLGADGSTIWSKRWGGGSYDYSAALALDPVGNVALGAEPTFPIDFGGGALAGDNTEDSAVVVVDTDGNHVWSRSLPFSIRGIVSVPSANEIVLVGDSETTIDLGTGPLESAGDFDVIVAALSP